MTNRGVIDLETCPTCGSTIDFGTSCIECGTKLFSNESFHTKGKQCEKCKEFSVNEVGLTLEKLRQLGYQNEPIWSSFIQIPHEKTSRSVNNQDEMFTIAGVLVGLGLSFLFLVSYEGPEKYILGIILIGSGFWTFEKLRESRKKIEHNQWVNSIVEKHIREHLSALNKHSICLSCGVLQVAGNPTMKKYWDDNFKEVEGYSGTFYEGWRATFAYKEPNK